MNKIIDLPLLLITYSFLFLLSSCVGHRDKSENTFTTNNKQESTKIIIPTFNSDSAYDYVKQQCDFGPRVPNTKAHDACAAYLIDKMKSFTPNVLVQKGTVTAYNKAKLNIQNIIAQFNPQAKNRILLFAHWDSRPWADQDTARQDEPILAADDAGSGVAVLMEVARQLSLNPQPVGIDIIFFDAEDYGSKKNERDAQDSYALGTQYWCRNPMPADYSANYGILLDMVGARNATFLYEGNSMHYAPDIARKVWNIAQQLGYGIQFLAQQGGPITDDHVYPNEILNIPCIDIIYLQPGSSAFGNHWHTHADNMDVIDRNTLKAVGQTLLAVLYGEGGA